MNFNDKELTSLSFNPFYKIGSEWAVLGTVAGEKTNAMTVSWGQVGVLWNKAIFTVYVRPTRHSFSLLEQTSKATLSFFPEDMKKTLSYFGRTSGRDEDKLSRSGINYRLENGALIFSDAQLTLVGKKLYYNDIDPKNFADKSLDENYQNDYHREYVFEITRIFQKGC